MIRSVSWFSAGSYGVFAPGHSSWRKQSPAVSATAEIMAIINRPVKYYGRLTNESRACLCAASVAMASWKREEGAEIGIVAAGFEGCLRANREYFRDYVDCGRTLGRGNLFIYTLPTSAAGEAAIALSLTGPCLFSESDFNPLQSLIHHAQQLASDGEADGMLAIWSDSQSAICIGIDGERSDNSAFEFLDAFESAPPQLIGKLQAMVQPT